MVFDEWVQFLDGEETESAITADLSFKWNGGSPQTKPTSLTDNHTTTTLDLTPKDGRLLSDTGNGVSIGDTITILAGTWTLTANEEFNPFLNDSTFTGNAFLIDNFGNQISDSISVVPEPAEYAFAVSAGLLVLAVARKRRLRQVRS